MNKEERKQHFENIKAFRQREIQRAENEERARAYSKRQLLERISRKFKTCMIGSIASMEEHFGHLWGQGKSKADLTEEELKYREVWEETRTDILNKGNSCLRGAQDELAQHAVNKEKYKVDLVVRPEDE